MGKRLQVILNDSEMREIQRAARMRRVTVAEWVRQALRAARRREPVGETGKKIQVMRAAVRHSFPTADLDQMLQEIEGGYVAEDTH
jgi:predicted 2-oxoglutarate/Fe(II)-dependent dioxygenase YbiX